MARGPLLSEKRLVAVWPGPSADEKQLQLLLMWRESEVDESARSLASCVLVRVVLAPLKRRVRTPTANPKKPKLLQDVKINESVFCLLCDAPKGTRMLS